LPNRFDGKSMDAVDVAEDIDGREPQDPVSLGFQIFRTASIMLDSLIRRMLAAINLDNQFGRVRGKIRVIGTNRNLPQKMGSAERIGP
jgi:hypothetical protein